MSDLLLMLLAVLVVHLTMFYAGMAAAHAFGMGREDSVAVGFAGSQKTLTVGLQVGLELQISILPMVAYHVVQLVVDTVIADRLHSQAGRTAARNSSA